MVKINQTKGDKLPINKGQNKDRSFNNKEYKIVKSLRENIKNWANIYGSERMFFMTLTFGDNVTCYKESQRRFNSFCTQFNRLDEVQYLYKGIEPQKSGRLHYHIIGYANEDLGGNEFDWESLLKAAEYWQKGRVGMARKYTKIYSKSANVTLKKLWAKVRKIAMGSKFGRTEFLPIRSASCVGKYVGKYLGKSFDASNNGTLPKGVRRFSYSHKAPQIHGRQFSWVNSPTGLTWRQKVKAWAHGMGVRENDMEDMRNKFGAKWALEQKDHINYYGSLWHNSDIRFGHARPAVYPTGILGNPLANMGTNKSLYDPFVTSENELWHDYLKGRGKTSSLGLHAQNLRKYTNAQKAKRLHDLIAP